MTEFDEDDSEIEETFDDLRWTVTRASGGLLAEVASLEGNMIWEEIMRFAMEKLNSNAWIDQYVGMTCLGAILAGPDQSVIFEQIDNSFQSIMNLFNNCQVSRVRYATGWVINILVINLPQVIYQSQENLDLFMTTALTHLEADHEHHTIKGFMAQAFENLFERNPEQVSKFTPYFANIVQSLSSMLFSNYALKLDILNVVSQSLCAVIQNCDGPNIPKQTLLEICANIFDKTSQFIDRSKEIFPSADTEQRELILDQYCSTMQPLLYHMGNEAISDQLLLEIV